MLPDLFRVPFAPLRFVWRGYGWQRDEDIGKTALLAGAFAGAIFVSFLTYVVNVSDAKDQARYLTYSATISSVAGAFGYLIGGFLGEFSIKGNFLIQAVTLIASGFLFYIICSSDKHDMEKLSAKQLAKDANPLGAFLDCRQFMTIAFITLFTINILPTE